MNMHRNFGLTKLPIEGGNNGCRSPRYVSGWWIVPILITSITFFFCLAWFISLVVE